MKEKIITYLHQIEREKDIQILLAFEQSSLPEQPDIKLINHLTFRLRERLYG